MDIPDNRSKLKWYQGLDRHCWVVLIIAALGWLFDTMDQNLFNLVRAPSVKDILSGQSPELTGKALDDATRAVGGIVQAFFLLGWSAGGFIFGILGDKLGRTRTMIITILIYAVFTGLSGAPFVQHWETYAAMRFITAIGVGGEWAAGAALVAETFPARSRSMALGLLQALSAVGNMSAALITLGISEYLGGLEDHWRLVYLIGAAPALLVLWIRRSVREPAKWQQARREATVGRELGNMAELFTNPAYRGHTIAATLMATAGVGALWGVGFFSTDLLRQELVNAGHSPSAVGATVSKMFMLQNLGAFFGIYLFAAVAEWLNRRKTFIVWFTLAWSSILIFFWSLAGAGAAAELRGYLLAPVLGFCTLGPFSGYSVYFPELFPTRLRATGLGFTYNAARVLAAGAPFALGQLSARLGGFAEAATVVSFVYVLGYLGTWLGPETKGRPLPEEQLEGAPRPEGGEMLAGRH